MPCLDKYSYSIGIIAFMQWHFKKIQHLLVSSAKFKAARQEIKTIAADQRAAFGN